MLSLLVYESPILISLNKPFQSFYLVYTAISALIFLYVYHMLSKRAGTKNFILINQYDERAGLSMYINPLLKSTIENITDQFILFVKIIISMRSVLLSWLNNSCDFLSPSMYADSAHDDYGHSDKKEWRPFLKNFETCIKPTLRSFCIGDSGGPSLVCEGISIQNACAL